MADDERLICDSGALAEGGSGVRFALKSLDGDEKGFAVRHGGRVCAFVNRCPHLGTELDWQPGEFFEEGGLYLVCSTHGAIFEPRHRILRRGAMPRRLARAARSPRNTRPGFPAERQDSAHQDENA